MKVRAAGLEGVLVVEPDVFGDARGFFMETYHRRKYSKLGIGCELVQDNLAFSRKGILRGLHLQHPEGQAKLVQVLQGSVFDVAVDVRVGSPYFGRWTGELLSQENRLQMFVPDGFAHGYCVISQTALFHYKCSDFYAPQHELGILWSDPDLGIEWPVQTPRVSAKDAGLPRLRDVASETLPRYESGRR